MSLVKLKNLCEGALDHLNALPDVREEKLNCNFPTEWNPEKQLNFELDSLATELQLTPCSQTATILSDIMTNSEWLLSLGAARYSNAFYLKYPVLVWILMVNYPKAATLYSYDNFIYYVAAELDHDYWTLRPSTSAPKKGERQARRYAIVPPVCRAYVKYVSWKKIKYLPGEMEDTLHRQICEKLFASLCDEQQWQKEEAELETLQVADFLFPILY